MSYISISVVVGDEIHSMQTVPFPRQHRTSHKACWNSRKQNVISGSAFMEARP